MVLSFPQNFTCEGNDHAPTWKDILKACIICIVTMIIIVGNMFSIVVFNNPRSRRFFRKKVRLTMNSLICTDFSVGVLVCPSTVYSALYHCWPFGEAFCKIEALLLAALFHESTLSLVLIALDRYLSVFHYVKYTNFMTSRKYVIAILSTWVAVFSTYAIVIFVRGQFYFDEIGINCEPYYENTVVTNIVIAIFYFLPAFLFVFSYGSIFWMASRRRSRFTGIAADSQQSIVAQTIKTSKYLAAISFGFFVAISPWSISTLIIANSGIKLHDDLDFAVTWVAISNSFWNVLIYSTMNKKFRNAASMLASRKSATIVRSSTLRKCDSNDTLETSIGYSSSELSLTTKKLSYIAAPVTSAENISVYGNQEETETNNERCGKHGMNCHDLYHIS